MNLLQTIGAILGAWTASVAAAIIAGLDRIVSPRVVRLVEADDGGFVVEATGKADAVPSRIEFNDGTLSAPNLAPLFRGSRVEIVLQPRRFLFRPLELPAQAAGFLDGIVRAQIDRLTPWSASEAVFGCSAPSGSAGGTGSITTVIAATTRKVAMTYVQAVSGFHPAAVAVCTDIAERDAGRVKVFEQKARGHLDAARLSRGLRMVLGVAAAAALLSTIAGAYVAENLGAQESELARQISARRAAIRAGSDGGDRSPIATLERRKYETPASVIVLDALSQVLPDHTYVTELHLAGDKLQIVGITRDAPSLISLIEQSQHFTRATFYAPTTRSPSDPGERFHIEARVQPKNTASP
jgi:general secretion pathway protein L